MEVTEISGSNSFINVSLQIKPSDFEGFYIY